MAWPASVGAGRKRDRAGELAGTLVVSILFTAALFGPVLGHFTTWLYGIIGDGPMTPATIALRLAAVRQGGLFAPLPYLLGAPFPPFDPGAIANPLWWYTAVALAVPLGPIGATNALVFASFVVTAAVTFLLLRHYGLPFGAALVGGLIYGFCPAHIAQAQEHALLLDQFWYVLVGWLLIAYTDRLGWRRPAALGAVLALAELDNPYLGYFAALLALAWFVGLLVGRVRAPNRRALTLLLAHGGVAISVLAAIIIPTQVRPLPVLLGVPQPASAGPPDRSLGDLEALSLRWWDLLLPFPENPLEGALGREAFGAHLGTANATEASVMAGSLALVLAVSGTVALVRQRWPNTKPESKRLLPLAVASIGVGVIAGLPPTLPLGGGAFPTPTLLFHVVAPEIRSLARSDGLIQLGVAILAAFGVAALLAWRTSIGWRAVVTVALCAGVAAEYFNAPPWRSIALLPAPGVDAWLARTPSAATGIVAVYPLQIVDAAGTNATGIEAFDAYAVHRHAIFNGAAPNGVPEALRRALTDRVNPATAGTWAALGVRTVVVPGGDAAAPGMRPVFSDGSRTAFAIVAAPLPLIAGVGDGFGTAVTEADGRQWRWIGAAARIAVDTVGDRETGAILWTRVHNNGGAHTLALGGAAPEPVSAASAASPVALFAPTATGVRWLTVQAGGPMAPERGSADPTPVSVEIRSLEPAPIRPLDALFTDGGRPVWRLTGVSADACTVRPGASLDVALLWTVNGATSRPQTVFVHLTGSSGALAAQADGLPDGGLATTTTEAVGSTVVDVHTLRLPATLPPGPFSLQVGLYDRDSGQRLALAAGGDTVTAGTIAVGPPPAAGQAGCAIPG